MIPFQESGRQCRRFLAVVAVMGEVKDAGREERTRARTYGSAGETEAQGEHQDIHL